MARRLVVLVIFGFAPVGVICLGLLGAGLLGLDFGLLARVPVAGGRLIPGSMVTAGLIGLLAAPVDR
jgi:hypothetical protein